MTLAAFLIALPGCRDRDDPLAPGGPTGELKLSISFAVDSLDLTDGSSPAEKADTSISLQKRKAPADSAARTAGYYSFDQLIARVEQTDHAVLSTTYLTINWDDRTFYGTMDVPSGPDRVVAVAARNQGKVVYLGVETGVNVPAGGTVELSIVLTDYVPVIFNSDQVSETGNYTINWTEVPYADLYIVQESLSNDFASYDSVMVFEATSYSFNGKPHGTRFVRVAAAGEYGIGLPGNPARVRITSPPDIVLLSPQDGAMVGVGEPVLFLVQAMDIDEGPLDDTFIEWESSRDGSFAIGAMVLYNGLLEGEHLITVIAHNSLGGSATASITLNVVPGGNRAPTVTLNNPSQGASFNYGTSILFLASGTDPEEGTLPPENFYWWSSQNGYLGSGNMLQYSSLLMGQHKITVMGRDASGAGGLDTVRISVVSSGSNSQPVARIVSPAQNGRFAPGTIVLLQGSADDVEDGKLGPDRLSWYSSQDGFLGKGEYVLAEGLSQGAHRLLLLAADNQGLTGSAEVAVSLETGGNSSPAVTITAPVSGAAFAQGASVNFQGYATDLEDGAIPGASLVWLSSIDGTIGQGTSLTTTQLSSGSHQVMLRVADSQGAVGFDTVTVNLSRPPVVQITRPADGSTFAIGTPVEFSGTAQDPEEGVLPAGFLVWRSSLVPAPIGSGASFITNRLGVGVHRIVLTAQDRLGVADSAAVTVQIVAVQDSLLTEVSVGANPARVRVNSAEGRAYITNNGANSVSVVDLTSLGEIGRISVGVNPFGLAISPALGRVYVTNSGSDDCSVISGLSLSLLQTIHVSFQPMDAALSPDESLVFVSNSNAASVSVINAAGGTVERTISSVGNSPRNMLIPPGSPFLFISNYGGSESNPDKVAAVNWLTDQIVSVNVGDKPLGLATNEDGSLVFVANYGSNSVSIIRTDNLTVINSPSVGQGPTACAVTPDNSQLYVVNSLSRDLRVIDIASKTVVETIPGVGTEPSDIAFYERTDGSLLALVTDRGAGRLLVLLVR